MGVRLSILSEFKEIAMKGSVIDLAAGMIIGAEFGKIVNSMVVDMIIFANRLKQQTELK